MATKLNRIPDLQERIAKKRKIARRRRWSKRGYKFIAFMSILANVGAAYFILDQNGQIEPIIGYLTNIYTQVAPILESLIDKLPPFPGM